MTDVRWVQRLESYSRALALLREAVALSDDQLTSLEREGTVHRFEFTFELAWKCLKDYLEWSGVALHPPSPRETFKVGYAQQILADGEVWMAMTNRRNWLTHVYDEAVFLEAVKTIRARFMDPLGELEAFLCEQRSAL